MTTMSAEGSNLLVGWENENENENDSDSSSSPTNNTNQQEVEGLEMEKEEDKRPSPQSVLLQVDGSEESGMKENNDEDDKTTSKTARTRRWGIGILMKEHDSDDDDDDDNDNNDDDGHLLGRNSNSSSNDSYDDPNDTNKNDGDGDGDDDLSYGPDVKNNKKESYVDNDDEEDEYDEYDEMNAIVSNNSNSNNNDAQQQQQQSQQAQLPARGLWHRFSISNLSPKMDTNDPDGDGATKGLLNNNDDEDSDRDNDNLSVDGIIGNGGKNSPSIPHNEDEDSSTSSYDISDEDESTKSNNSQQNEQQKQQQQQQQQQKQKQKQKQKKREQKQRQQQQRQDESKKSLVNNEESTQNEPEKFVMKNEILGIGSHQVSPHESGSTTTTITTTSTTASTLAATAAANNKPTGLSGFFYNLQLRRIKARHEFDPFSLTKEELEILKNDIEQNCNDLKTMDTTSIVPTGGGGTTVSDSNKKGWKESLQAAVLAPEAFAAYADRIIEEDDGEDNMGYYRNVAVANDDDIADDYELREKKMKPMKMVGDEITWGDVADVILDPDSYVIGEDEFIHEEDPQGVYRGVALACDDEDDDIEDKAATETEVKKEQGKDKGGGNNIQVEELRMQVMKLTAKVRHLETELKSKDEESQIWKNKVCELEVRLGEAHMNDKKEEEMIDLFDL